MAVMRLNCETMRFKILEKQSRDIVPGKEEVGYTDAAFYGKVKWEKRVWELAKGEEMIGKVGFEEKYVVKRVR